MKKLATLVAFAIGLGSIVGLSEDAHAQAFTACEGTFALCTSSPCYPVPGNDKIVKCHCTINQGYSAGQAACEDVKQTPQGEAMKSRYYPVHTYAVCKNDRPWAWCLDKPCTSDPNHSGQALCACDVVKNLGAYVVGTTSYYPEICTTGVISSATVQQITQVTDFLKTTKVVDPGEFKALNK